MTKHPKVLIVATSASNMPGTDQKTGLWLEELTTPFYDLKDAGAEITLASISGGAIPLDGNSLSDAAKASPSERRFAADPDFQTLIRETPKADDFKAADFDAIFLPGGHGTMFDFADSPALARLVAEFDAEGKIVAAVCHGPAGLLGARRKDGKPLVQGRRVAGFSNAEEETTGLKALMPYLLESRLRELGGKYESAPNFTPFAVRDGNLITGQNPQSATPVAAHVIEALGLKQMAA